MDSWGYKPCTRRYNPGKRGCRSSKQIGDMFLQSFCFRHLASDPILKKPKATPTFLETTAPPIVVAVVAMNSS